MSLCTVKRSAGRWLSHVLFIVDVLRTPSTLFLWNPTPNCQTWSSHPGTLGLDSPKREFSIVSVEVKWSCAKRRDAASSNTPPAIAQASGDGANPENPVETSGCNCTSHAASRKSNYSHEASLTSCTSCKVSKKSWTSDELSVSETTVAASTPTWPQTYLTD